MTNDCGLLIKDGHCVGYLFNFQGHGTFSPDGKVEVTQEQMDTHNRLLSEGEIKGLDECCQIGQCGTFYYVKGQVQTFVGVVVCESPRVRGNVLTFTRKGKTFRGRLQADADCFNFKRIS